MTHCISKWAKAIALSAFVFILLPVTGYSQVKTDTIEIANQLRYHRHFGAAIHILEKYHQYHKDSIRATWMMAQVYYWKHDYENSEKYYLEALGIDPENFYLQLDYAKFLMMREDYEKIESIVQKCLERVPLNEEALLIEAKIQYWKGDLDKARNTAKLILANNHDHEEGVRFAKEILTATSTYVKLTGGYQRDGQPLRSLTRSVEAGTCFHRFAFTSINFNAPAFRKEGDFFENDTHKVYHPMWFSVNNKAVLFKSKWEFLAGAGVVKFPDGETDFIGHLGIHKTLFHHLRMELMAEKKPFFYTRYSIGANLASTTYSASAEWNKEKSFHAKTGYDRSYFPDGNFVWGAYIWGLAPAMKLGPLEVKVGYSFNYQTSNDNRWNSVQTLDSIIVGYHEGKAIKGYFDPYFTPNNQQIHAALLNLKLKLGKAIEWGANVNYGFNASTYNPYLFLDKDPQNEVFINRQFHKVTLPEYSPKQIGTYLYFKIGDKSNLKASYTYTENLYYSYNTFYLSYRMSIWNDTPEH